MSKSLRRVKAALAKLGLENTIRETAGATTAQMATDAVGCDVDKIGKSIIFLIGAIGQGAWVVAMSLGFIFFWPVGLALLAYMIWSKKNV